ncbi:MAG: hypothetical protein K2P49_01235 [Oscillospiraceae bacterium]|nr:hypothetical protein [Oscillospiraceae bacterium]
MDIKKIIEDIVEKIKSDEALQKQFLSDPAGALEKLIGIDLPTEQLDAVISGVKAKLTADNIGDAVKGLGNLFKK